MNIAATDLHLNQKLISPNALKLEFKLSENFKQQIDQSREVIRNILSGQDKRLMVIVGPCSVHDPEMVLQYASCLKVLQERVADSIYIVMRTYIEKPRTTIGWKGYLYDPHLDGSANVNFGLESSRNLFLKIIELGLPIAGEILNPMMAMYFDDLFSWGAIGARTSESQIHREIASYLKFPIGFKNTTDGSIQVAMDAIASASNPHDFIGIDQDGQTSLLRSHGNIATHLILRGSHAGPNYAYQDVRRIKENSQQNLSGLVIDCSHGNSAKNHLNQKAVLKTVIEERHLTEVKGVMLESFMVEGKQIISHPLVIGQSITDACLGWEDTSRLLLEAHTLLKQNRMATVI